MSPRYGYCSKWISLSANVRDGRELLVDRDTLQVLTHTPFHFMREVLTSCARGNRSSILNGLKHRLSSGWTKLNSTGRGTQHINRVAFKKQYNKGVLKQQGLYRRMGSRGGTIRFDSAGDACVPASWWAQKLVDLAADLKPTRCKRQRARSEVVNLRPRRCLSVFPSLAYQFVGRSIGEGAGAAASPVSPFYKNLLYL